MDIIKLSEAIKLAKLGIMSTGALVIVYASYKAIVED